MKIYRYWAIERGTIRVDGKVKGINCYGGSNVSEEDARAQAQKKIEKIQNKIQGDSHAFDQYEVEIREEIVQIIDEKSIVTRNRYGAQVLNVLDQMVLDIDRPKASLRDLFRRQADAKDKAKIIEMVKALSRKPMYQGCSFRIYETHSGIRVIVLGKTFDPRAQSTASMMKEFNCDAFYTLLCQKQACFRARLTPKPSRMKLKGYKVKFPRDTESEKEFQSWLTGYEAASKDFSVCKFVEQIGGSDLPEAVQLHDEITGIEWNQKLA